MKKENKSNLLPVLIMFLLAAVFVNVPLYFSIKGKTNPDGASNLIYQLADSLDIYIIPMVFAVFILLGIITSFLTKTKVEVKAPETKKGENVSGKKEQEHKDRRMYLSLLSLLQKEGRLLDFFSEDLSNYEDGEIGAAVRGVHENCKRVVSKYIETEHVLSQNEGEEITIEEDFDPDTIKLTGNVTGKPPFKGIIVHRGWQAKKADVPKLSDSVNSKLIVPAEVEIK